MSQHQPHQGTTTEGMSFPTECKEKKNRKAQHHTAHSLAFPFQRKAGQLKKSLKNKWLEKINQGGCQITIIFKRTQTLYWSNLEDYLSLKPDPRHKSRLYLCHSDCQFHLLTSAAAENGLVLLQTSHRGQGRLGRTLTMILTVTFFSCIQ